MHNHPNLPGVPMIVAPPSIGVACYLCAGVPGGQCLACGRYYCGAHGWRYCNGCRARAVEQPPAGIDTIAGGLQIVSLLLLGMATLAAGTLGVLLLRGQSPPTAIVTLIGVALLCLLVGGIALPLFIVGVALRRGARWAHTLALLAAIVALLAFPLGTLLGLLALRMLLADDVREWLAICQTL